MSTNFGDLFILVHPLQINFVVSAEFWQEFVGGGFVKYLNVNKDPGKVKLKFFQFSITQLIKELQFSSEKKHQKSVSINFL